MPRICITFEVIITQLILFISSIFVCLLVNGKLFYSGFLWGNFLRSFAAKHFIITTIFIEINVLYRACSFLRRRSYFHKAIYLCLFFINIWGSFPRSFPRSFPLFLPIFPRLLDSTLSLCIIITSVSPKFTSFPVDLVLYYSLRLI